MIYLNLEKRVVLNFKPEALPEIWKIVQTVDINNKRYDIRGFYEVSSHGNVRCEGRPVSTYLCDGYPRFSIKIYDKKKRKLGIVVHRLVAYSFIPNPKNKPQINHMYGDKEDNRYWRLEWCTLSENSQHAYDTGLTIPPRGEARTITKYSDAIIHQVCQMLQDGYGSRYIAEKMSDVGISRQAINQVRHGTIRSEVSVNYNIMGNRKPPDMLTREDVIYIRTLLALGYKSKYIIPRVPNLKRVKSPDAMISAIRKGRAYSKYRGNTL